MELSVLIRTSNREESFNRLLATIPDWVNIIVSVDSDTAKEYAPRLLQGRPHTIVEVDKKYHYNEYFQFMYPKTGWIHCMDDDDYYHPQAFEFLRDCTDTSKVYIFRLMKYRLEKWKLSPKDRNFKRQRAVLGNIATSNIVFHASQAKSQWGAYSGGDYTFISDMINTHGSIWVDKILIYAPVKGRGIV